MISSHRTLASYGRTLWRFWRLAIISAVMLAAAYLVARPNQPFFYQGF